MARSSHAAAVRNALDDLLPGPTPEPSLAARRVPTDRPPRGRNALDDLLPGPSSSELPIEPIPLRREPRHQHMGAFHPLAEDVPAPRVTRPVPARRRAAAPTRVRTTFRVSREVLLAARDAAGELSRSSTRRVTIDDLVEQGLSAQVERNPRDAKR